MTSCWNLKPISVSQGILEKLSWKLLSDVVFPSLPANPPILVLENLLKILVSSCRLTSFSRCCLANPMFLLLRWPIYRIKPNWNKKKISIFQILFEELSLKLLCNVICKSLPDQSHVLWLAIGNFSRIATPGNQISKILLY